VRLVTRVRHNVPQQSSEHPERASASAKSCLVSFSLVQLTGFINKLAFPGDRDAIRPNYLIAGQNGAFRSDNAATIAAAAAAAAIRFGLT